MINVWQTESFSVAVNYVMPLINVAVMSSFMSVYVCVYVDACVCVYVDACVCVCGCVWVCGCMCLCVCGCMRLCVCGCMRLCVSGCMCLCVLAHMHAHMFGVAILFLPLTSHHPLSFACFCACVCVFVVVGIHILPYFHACSSLKVNIYLHIIQVTPKK